MSLISKNLRTILERANNAMTIDKLKGPPRLVAVSKFKSEENIIEAYKEGQRHFGENYAKELEQKANSIDILKQCPEIKWHFIGNLQSSKCNKIASLPNMFLVETVDSIEIADKLNKSSIKNRKNPLNIMLQINTSNEPQKNGLKPESIVQIYKHIFKNCAHLKILGLMTIGSFADSVKPDGINKDFQVLNECRSQLVNELNIDSDKIELSMGMSHDFEKAIIMGSTNVRVGSLIFGERVKQKSQII